MASLSDFQLRTIDGEECSLGDYKGKVVLIVNVASKCGLTPQYDGLQRLYDQYRRQGLEILGFPCNQFMGQEPGSEAEIKEFCSLQYGVSFPLFEKIEVKGEGQHPLYGWLTGEDTSPTGPGEVEWNFAKFVIGRDGSVLARFSPQVEPCSDEITAVIEEALA